MEAVLSLQNLKLINFTTFSGILKSVLNSNIIMTLKHDTIQ